MRKGGEKKEMERGEAEADGGIRKGTEKKRKFRKKRVRENE